MGPVVRNLTLKGFRSVPSGRIDFDNPTFLVGRNGSGKSNIADAFAFLAEAMTSPLQEVFDRRGGLTNVLHKRPDKDSPQSLAIAVECDPRELLRNKVANFEEIAADSRSSVSARYAFEVKPLPEYRFEIVREQCVVTTGQGNTRWLDRTGKRFRANVEPFNGKAVQMMAEESLAITFLASAFSEVFQILSRMRVYSIEPSRLREMQDPDSGANLRRDGANAASVLDEIARRAPWDLERIKQFLSAVVPDTNSVATVRHGQKLALEFMQEWDTGKRLNFEAFSMSDGTLRAFGLLLAVYQRETPSLIVVEEPEASIHPGAAGAILDLLRHASNQMQVIVSTHSPEILDAKWIEDNNLRVVIWQKGATQVSNISVQSKKALQKHLMGAGELLRSEALEPTPLFEDVTASEQNLFEEVG